MTTAASTIAQARSLLFVPGTHPERFSKAESAQPDVVLIDLEDAVAPGDKPRARANATAWLSQHAAAVRINTGPDRDDDLQAIATSPGLLAVIVPKAESSDDITAVAGSLPRPIPVLALVETALGLQQAPEIARSPGVARLIFGNVDFTLDAGINCLDADESELRYARSALVVASRAANLPSPVDGVQVDLDNVDQLFRTTRTSRALGFSGRLCLHPSQVRAVHEALAPTAAQIAWAKQVVAVAGTSGGAAVRVGSRMIDRPLVDSARAVLLSVRGRSTSK